jgi:hypothetical protein
MWVMIVHISVGFGASNPPSYLYAIHKDFQT